MDAITKLRAALQPFSMLGRPSPELANYHDIPSDTVIYDDGSGVCFTAGDVRFANSTMQRTGPITPSPVAEPVADIFTPEQVKHLEEFQRSMTEQAKLSSAPAELPEYPKRFEGRVALDDIVRKSDYDALRTAAQSLAAEVVCAKRERDEHKRRHELSYKAMRDAEQQLSAATQRADEAVRDARRMDWMEINMALISVALDGSWTEVITVGVNTGGIIGRGENMLRASGRWRGDSLRAAIDAALKEKG